MSGGGADFIAQANIASQAHGKGGKGGVNIALLGGRQADGADKIMKGNGQSVAENTGGNHTMQEMVGGNSGGANGSSGSSGGSSGSSGGGGGDVFAQAAAIGSGMVNTAGAQAASNTGLSNSWASKTTKSRDDSGWSQGF